MVEDFKDAVRPLKALIDVSILEREENQEYKLIEVVRQGQGKPNRLYVLDYEVSADTLKELSYENKKAVTAGTDTTNSNSKNNDSNNSIPQKQDNDTRKSKKNNFGNNYQNKPKNKNGIKCVNDTFKNYKADELEKKLLHKWDAPLVNDFLAMIFYGKLKQKCVEIFKEEG